MKKHSEIQLEAESLSIDGTLMRLTPVRPKYPNRFMNDSDLDLAPTLNLKLAGIPKSCDEQKLRASVTKFLRSHRFSLHSDDPQFFDPFLWIRIFVDGVSLLAKTEIRKLQAERPLLRPHNFRSELEADYWRELPRGSMFFKNIGAPVRGLDLSKTMSAWRGTVLTTLIPPTAPEYVALKKASNCFIELADLLEYEEKIQSGVRSLLPNWWHNIWMKKKSALLTSNIKDFETAKLAVV
jgi:hypothetical protein